MLPLQLALADAGVTGILLLLVVPFLVVTAGTYVGVSLALNSYFGPPEENAFARDERDGAE